MIPKAALPHRIAVRRWIGTTGDGTPTYGTSATIPARVQGRRTKTIGSDGASVTGSATALVQATDIDPEALVTVLVGPFASKVFRVVGTEAIPGGHRDHGSTLVLEGPR